MHSFCLAHGICLSLDRLPGHFDQGSYERTRKSVNISVTVAVSHPGPPYHTPHASARFDARTSSSPPGTGRLKPWTRTLFFKSPGFGSVIRLGQREKNEMRILFQPTFYSQSETGTHHRTVYWSRAANHAYYGKRVVHQTWKGVGKSLLASCRV